MQHPARTQNTNHTEMPEDDQETYGADMTKKLYSVTIQYRYYALCESPQQAACLAPRALNDIDPADNVDIDEVSHPRIPIDPSWTGDCVVYSDENPDVTLDQALTRVGLPCADQMGRSRLCPPVC